MFLVSFFGLCFWVVILGAVFLCCVVELCFRVVFVCCVFGLFGGGRVFGICFWAVSLPCVRTEVSTLRWQSVCSDRKMIIVFGLCFWVVFFGCVFVLCFV